MVTENTIFFMHEDVSSALKEKCMYVIKMIESCV